MTQKILAQCLSAHFIEYVKRRKFCDAHAKAEINDKLNYNTHFQTTFSFCIIFGAFSLKSVLKVVKSPIFCIGRGTNTQYWMMSLNTMKELKKVFKKLYAKDFDNQ